MSYERERAAILVGSILIAFATISTAAETRQEVSVVGQEYPIIRLALGDSFSEIRTKSIFQFPSREMTNLEVVASDTPVIFEYTRNGCQFILPPALSFSAAIDDLHATRVVVSPHLQYLKQSDAEALIKKLISLFGSSGWSITKQYFSIEQVKTIFNDPKTPSDHTIRMLEWGCNGDELYLQIERHWRANDSLPRLTGRSEDLYVVTIKIENDRVRERYAGR
jgi:hypothetical protein